MTGPFRRAHREGEGRKNREPLPERILALLRQQRSRPISRHAISDALRIGQAERAALRSTLRAMARKGEILKIKSQRYTLPRDAELIAGVLQAHRHGFGFVTPREPSLGDIYIHRENMSTALDGDTVLVRIIPSQGRRRRASQGPEGEIAEVIERSHKPITGTVQRSGHFHYVMPDNPAIFQDVYVSAEDLGGASVGDRVVVKMTLWTSKHLNPEGTIVKVLGPGDDLKTDAEAVIERYVLPRRFPRPVTAEALRIDESIPQAEYARRTDLRAEEIFTIDPETAKDFDDAISLRRDRKGRFLLGVHIADVSHYVVEGTDLDAEARKRGNSTYLLDRVIPMLPHRLADDLCSLQPHVDRLTKSVFMTFSAEGVLCSYDFADSVICSKKRFTYREVQEILDGKVSSAHQATLREMAGLARTLFQRRLRRGSADLDLSEIRVVLGKDGAIARLDKEGRDQAHNLIEEFMIAANETVARHLSQQRVPTIYRVHDEPKPGALKEFSEAARQFGHRIAADPTPHDIQRLLAAVKGRPESYVLSLVFLRTMKIAEYSASNIGHYGLASEFYLHFTSPIRRYPDLVAHRCLSHTAPHARQELDKRLLSLGETAAHCSETERNSDAAEEDLTQTAVLRYLAQAQRSAHPPTLNGAIKDIKTFGMVIHLSDYLTEGIIRFSSLTDDFYSFSRETRRLIGAQRKRVFSLGQPVKVRLKKVDVVGREIELVLA